MNIGETTLDGLVLLTPRRFTDGRGFFSEVWNKRQLVQLGLDVDFVQDNQSLSTSSGTLRGLHYQKPPFGQAKLVRCSRGRLLDVALDVRVGSGTYGRFFMVELSFENGRQLFIPEGFLHGFLTLEENTEISYKCSNYYSPLHEGVIDAASCSIPWPLDDLLPKLSPKDMVGVPFGDFVSPFI